MDPSSEHHHHQQEMSSQTLESMLVCTKSQQEKKPRPPEQALKCPRCDSANTKFCYYNNYSLSQPRYFCKSCRRYWTKGGTLRNVPVGGGCRKNKRSSSSASSKRTPDQPLIAANSNPLSSLSPLSYDSGDLSLAFARLQKQAAAAAAGQMGFDHEHDHLSMLGNPSSTHCDIMGNHIINTSAAAQPSFLDAFRGGFLETTSGFQNLYYGMHGTDNGGLSLSVGEEMGMQPYEDHMSTTTSCGGGTTTATTVTTVKQEMCNAREGDQNRVLWGFPWQVGGDGNMAGGDLDVAGAGRQSWNGFGSSWHGLLNSPLM